MLEIKELLLRWSSVLLSEEVKIDCIREIISKETGKTIERGEIEVKDNIVYLNIKPIYKSEVFLKQDAIFLKLKDALGRKTPTSIR